MSPVQQCTEGLRVESLVTFCIDASYIDVQFCTFILLKPEIIFIIVVRSCKWLQTHTTEVSYECFSYMTIKFKEFPSAWWSQWQHGGGYVWLDQLGGCNLWYLGSVHSSHGGHRPPPPWSHDSQTLLQLSVGVSYYYLLGGIVYFHNWQGCWIYGLGSQENYWEPNMTLNVQCELIWKMEENQ